MHKQLSSFTAIVGIDWADKKHDVCVQALNSSQRQFDRFSHKVEAIDDWARSLYRRHGGRMAVAVELSKGPIVAALQKYDFFVIYPINPTTLARYRQAFNPSGAKDDPTDAELAAAEFIDLAQRVWPGDYDRTATETALTWTINATARDSGRLIGAVRVLSDGYFFSTIPELLVDPGFQGLGVGPRLMELAWDASPTSLLFGAQPGKESFYEALG